MPGSNVDPLILDTDDLDSMGHPPKSVSSSFKRASFSDQDNEFFNVPVYHQAPDEPELNEDAPLESANPVPTEQRKNNYYWQKTVEWLLFWANACNTGIVITAISHFLPIIDVLTGGVFLQIALVADPMIYFFHFSIRLVRIIAREGFGIVLNEEERGRAHPLQTLSDVVSGLMLIASVPLFCGLIITGPVGMTVAWSLAISALFLSSYCDYVYPARKAREDFEVISASETATDLEKQDAEHESNTLNNSMVFYFGMLASVALLVISTSAVAYASPLLVPVLNVLSTLASIGAVVVAGARIYNQRERAKYEIERALRNENTAKLVNDLSADEEADNTFTSTAKITLATENAPVAPLTVVIPPETHQALVIAEINTPKGDMYQHRLFSAIETDEKDQQEASVSSEIFSFTN